MAAIDEGEGAGMIQTLGIGAAAGGALGALALYLAPGFGLRAVESRLTKCELSAQAHQQSFEDSEAIRDSEDQTATLATEDERLDCEDRIARQVAIARNACQIVEPRHETACPDLRPASEWMRNPGVDDPG
jgi:hypothetical protein